MTDKDTELKILKFWEDNRIYEKCKEKNKDNEKFYFMDGPPYASGELHIGTAMNKILKDAAIKSQLMQGKDVFARPGYDTHGVPIEIKIEQEIGAKSKKDIEKFGIKNFMAKCREFATKHIDSMQQEFKNLGVWMDWDNPYVTCKNEYIEAIWYAFKESEKKGLLYLGKYPVHVCPRCATAVSYNEIEYIKQKDNSIYVKFPLKNKDKTYLIVWTTTPWTLPGNTGVMVHPDITYQEIEVLEGERWIIAKDLVPTVMAMLERGYTVIKEYKGKEMEGWEYENPLKKYINVNPKNSYRVILSARYVTTEEGTGLVHTAPGHGKEDYEAGTEAGLDAISPVDIQGYLTDEAGKYAGKKARVVDREIIDDLAKDGYLVKELTYEHDYPVCWRDKEPLLMISLPQWFLKITSIKERLLSHNETVNWIPSYMKLRMKAWLENIGDWPVSRQRYWGTPLPIWTAEDGDRIVVGSIKELEELSGKKITDLHKPEIDEITIEKNGKIYKRVPEVLDVWFDSGVASWAALNFPQEDKLFEKYWPADLNIEGKDQFRGWWNSQLILSEISFGKKPYSNILVHGMVLDIQKRKLSKSLGNVVTPSEIIEKFSRDYMRYYFCKISKGEDFKYDESEMREIRKVLNVLNNLNRYIDELEPSRETKRSPEDLWIESKFHSLIKNVIENYNNFRFFDVIPLIEKFVLFDLSRTYIKLIRERSNEVSDLLNEIRIGVLKLFAPIIPFYTEEKWQKLREKNIVKEESIFLSGFPLINDKKINPELEREFEYALKIIEKGLYERDKNKINLRWPLKKATIFIKEELKQELHNIIKQQLNLKTIEFKKHSLDEIKVDLDLEMDKSLIAEGYAREFSRNIQAFRKKLGYIKTEKINLQVVSDEETLKYLKENENFIKQRVNAENLFLLNQEPESPFKNSLQFETKDKKFKVFLEKLPKTENN